MTGFYDGVGDAMFDSPHIEFEGWKPADLANAVVLNANLPRGSLPLESPIVTRLVAEAGVDGRIWVMLPDEAEAVSEDDLTTMVEMLQEGSALIISAADDETVQTVKDDLLSAVGDQWEEEDDDEDEE